jgi:hypothetical protein
MDIRLVALEDTLRRLIAGATIRAERIRGSVSDTPLYEVSRQGVTFRLVSGKPDFVFILLLHGVGTWRYTISRTFPAFSRNEEGLFGRLPRTLLKAFSVGEDDRRDGPGWLGALLALDHLFVAQVLRRERTGGYWTHLVILQALIDLTFSRYEGIRATSGVVYTSQPELFIDQVRSRGFTFGAFTPTHFFDRNFFSNPASYRYVDGKNAFYLVDNRREVWGVLRAERPEDFTLVDRCAGLHVHALVSHMPGRVWCAFIGLNDDVQVRTAQGLSFSWRANHWRVRDDVIIRTLLVETGLQPDIADLLARTLEALSELRKGALILIPVDDFLLPKSVAQIDTSTLASLLNAQLEQQPFEAIFRANAAIQVLSSDGLTIISVKGNLLACGRIIDLAGVAGGAGGGRTQAAMAASHFGLAIKVSADGPIAVYKDARRVLSL